VPKVAKVNPAVRASPPAAHEAPPTNTGIRLLSKRQVLDRVGVTYVTLWNWMRAGTFPRARVMVGKSCWIESEVDAWAAALPERRLKGDADLVA
jgi:predicted DNA-binding transcriptional regulator AlpA